MICLSELWIDRSARRPRVRGSGGVDGGGKAYAAETWARRWLRGGRGGGGREKAGNRRCCDFSCLPMFISPRCCCASGRCFRSYGSMVGGSPPFGLPRLQQVPLIIDGRMTAVAPLRNGAITLRACLVGLIYLAQAECTRVYTRVCARVYIRVCIHVPGYVSAYDQQNQAWYQDNPELRSSTRVNEGKNGSRPLPRKTKTWHKLCFVGRGGVEPAM